MDHIYYVMIVLPIVITSGFSHLEMRNIVNKILPEVGRSKAFNDQLIQNQLIIKNRALNFNGFCFVSKHILKNILLIA